MKPSWYLSFPESDVSNGCQFHSCASSTETKHDRGVLALSISLFGAADATSAVSTKQTEKLILLLIWMLITVSGTLEETSSTFKFIT